MPEAALERDAVRLFEQLLDHPEDERNARAESAASGRPDLLSRVEALLAADRRAALRTGAASEALDPETAPDRVGVYRIVDLIGRGGMGSVYRAERDAGDFAHVVAVKVIKPGLLSEALIERFRRERQLLARLTHPNIARLYDGGETPEGAPYIVMELVQGLPLLDFAEAQALGLDRRLRLFADICAAGAFAHRHLIVHRDLTPSNVLVTSDGLVKLIDFGIARPADDAAAAGEAAPVSVASLSLTPGYAAPERMVSANVTTAADIYSLGRVLHKLVPAEARDRELDAIVARATALDPADRHPTVEALAAEVEAWRTGFPVRSWRTGNRYRARKFVARHRLAVGLAAAMVALLLIAMALTLRSDARAAAARDAEAARFAELRSLANYLVFDLPGMLERVAGNVEARAAMADRAQAYLSALAASPGADDGIRLEAGRGLVALARVQGVPGHPNLGQTDRARANLDRAITLLGRPARSAAPSLAEALSAMSLIQGHADADVDAAGATQRRAVAVLARVPAGERSADWHAARSMLRRAQLEHAVLAQDHDRLLGLTRRIESEIGTWPAEMRNGRAAAMNRALASHYRGYHGYFTDRLEEGLSALQDAERRLVRLVGPDRSAPYPLYVLMWNAYVGYGVASGLPGREAEARRFLDLAERTSARLLEIEPNDNSLKSFAGNVRQIRVEALTADGQFGEALALQRQVVQLYQAAAGPQRRAAPLNRLVLAHVVLGNTASQAGDWPLACASNRAAARLLAELDRRGELFGFVASYRAGLGRNLERCRPGGPGDPLEQLG